MSSVSLVVVKEGEFRVVDSFPMFLYPQWLDNRNINDMYIAALGEQI